MSRTPLVLVPGLLCDRLMWEEQVKSLADIADIRIADHTRSPTMAGVARDVLADAPFKTFALAGLSMGGYISFEMMRQAAGRVTRLALLDTSAHGESAQQTERRMGQIAMTERGNFPAVTEGLLPLLIHPSRLTDKPLTDAIKLMARNIGKDAFVRQQHAIMSRADSRPLLAGITCPTLVLCGRQDTLTPPERHGEIAAAIGGARLEIIDDCGHMSTMEKPAAVTAALRRWLTG